MQEFIRFAMQHKGIVVSVIIAVLLFLGIALFQGRPITIGPIEIGAPSPNGNQKNPPQLPTLPVLKQSCEELEEKLKQFLKKADTSDPPSASPVQVKITFPKNESKVDEFITMEGTVSGYSKNSYLWIVSREKDTLAYYPQDEEIIPSTNESWKSSGVKIGGNESAIGKHHELKVIQANDIMHESIKLYFEIGNTCGKWHPFLRINGTKQLAVVTVVRN